MKTVVITAAFDGYPDGRTKRPFVAGEEPTLSDTYADLLIGKGLAREAETTTEAAAAKPAGRKERSK